MSADIDADTNDLEHDAVRVTHDAGVATDPDGSASGETDETSRTGNTHHDQTADDAVGGLFGRVLVVVDGEATGEAAAAAGIDLAVTHGASVDALYVVDTTEAWDIAVERRERVGEAAVEAAEARGRERGVDVEKWFRYGTAHQEVLEFAEAHDVDVIVVGSARRTGLGRLVRPETLPVRVQRGGSVPVLVVGTDE